MYVCVCMYVVCMYVECAVCVCCVCASVCMYVCVLRVRVCVRVCMYVVCVCSTYVVRMCVHTHIHACVYSTITCSCTLVKGDWSNLISCGTAPASTTALVCNDEPEATLVNIQQHSNYRVVM